MSKGRIQALLVCGFFGALGGFLIVAEPLGFNPTPITTGAGMIMFAGIFAIMIGDSSD